MEGKKCWAFFQDCRGVSEVYGQLLMMSIVVIAFSTIGATVFSDGGAVKPEHTPNTDLRENIKYVEDDVYAIQIVHSGGEAIDLKAIEIILNVNGEQLLPYNTSNFEVQNPDGTFRIKNSDGTFKVDNPDGPDYINNVFSLGDSIVIYTTEDTITVTGEEIDLKRWDDIDMFFIDEPSQQVIQRAVLQKGSGEFPDWITPYPYGSVYDNSTNEQLPTELVDGIDDELYTNSSIKQQEWVSENYTFGIAEYDLGTSDSLKNVSLMVVYNSHDDSLENMTLSVYNGSAWTMIAYNMDEKPREDDDPVIYNITEWVKNTTELEKLIVSFSAIGHASDTSSKIDWVDFVGIHVEL